MSQKATRKSQNPVVIIIADDKEKADSPVKEMKKKIAANAEKDKQTAEKLDKPADKSDKSEPADKNKSAEKTDKSESKTDKNAEKTDKNAEKMDKNADKTDKNADKSDKPAEKKSDKSEKATDKKSDKSGDKKADKSMEKKSEPAEKDESKGDKAKDKAARAVNGHNGAANGNDANGTVSDGSDGDLVIEEDEAFPELTYDDSDTDVEDAPSRSFTRRSQSKESKVLKLNETVAPSDRKLRSADSPKPDSKKDKKLDSPKIQEPAQEEEKKSKKDREDAEKKEAKDGKTDEKIDVEVVIEVESTEGVAPRTRARVSPYSRTRLDRTATSVTADYTGNNSTMEMDITESSSILEDPSLNDSGYLRGIRAIRGRSSYKLLKEIKLTNPNAGRPRPPPTVGSRPTGAVVGRKRKPSSETAGVEVGVEAGVEAEELLLAHGKRMRLLDRLAQPFRRNVSRRAAEISVQRLNAEIVGINTDLPLGAPVASTSFAAFDPETIKPAAVASTHLAGEPVATPLPPPAYSDRDGKRCILM